MIEIAREAGGGRGGPSRLIYGGPVAIGKDIESYRENPGLKDSVHINDFKAIVFLLNRTDNRLRSTIVRELFKSHLE